MSASSRDVDRGDVVAITVEFRNSAGVLANPASVVFQVRTAQSQAATSYTYPSTEIARPSTGTYVLSLPITTQYRHIVRAVGSGGGVDAAVTGTIEVKRDGFI